MNNSNQKEGMEALDDFFNQLGPPNIYNTVVLQVLFEYLIDPEKHEKIIRLFSEKGQERGQITDSSSRQYPNNPTP